MDLEIHLDLWAAIAGILFCCCIVFIRKWKETL